MPKPLAGCASRPGRLATRCSPRTLLLPQGRLPTARQQSGRLPHDRRRRMTVSRRIPSLQGWTPFVEAPIRPVLISRSVRSGISYHGAGSSMQIALAFGDCIHAGIMLERGRNILACAAVLQISQPQIAGSVVKPTNGYVGLDATDFDLANCRKIILGSLRFLFARSIDHVRLACRASSVSPRWARCCVRSGSPVEGRLRAACGLGPKLGMRRRAVGLTPMIAWRRACGPVHASRHGPVK